MCATHNTNFKLIMEDEFPACDADRMYLRQHISLVILHSQIWKHANKHANKMPQSILECLDYNCE